MEVAETGSVSSFLQVCQFSVIGGPEQSYYTLKVIKTMKEANQNLTLDRPARYQIKIKGSLNESWLDHAEDMTLTVIKTEAGYLLSVLTGVFDQAALLGLLRRLYALGTPLISVICLDSS